MTGRLFLHIGPPKTATTSLQVALEALDHSRYVYGGAFQPRERNHESLASDLHRTLLGDGSVSTRFLERVRDLVSAGNLVMISEEMISLEQESISTYNKIYNLGRILSGIDSTVIITLRDPVEALPSLYQEVYRGLSLDLQIDFPRFCNSGRSDCYDYVGLVEFLADAGLQDIRWLDFCDVREGRITTADIFGKWDLWGGQSLHLERLNTSAKGTDGLKRQLPGLTWRAIRRNSAVARIIDSLGLRGGRLTRFLGTVLDRVPLRKERSTHLLVPADRAAELADGFNALRLKLKGQG